jgi:16S rRNA C967 or C1407 C5-methylase (RsmB/RsmF family)
MNLPIEFTNRMREMLQEDYEDFAASYERPRKPGLRGNRLKDGVQRFEESGLFGMEEIPWALHGYYYDPAVRPGKHPFHEAGVYYMQEPSAMAVAALSGVKPGMRVLDLCAAPGGKSTQIGIKMKGEGLLVCNEPVPKRAQILSRNIERMGIPNSVVTCMVPTDLPHAWDECFDGVLADAPCSGEGMFRRDPETRREWSEEAAAGCAKRQEEILEEAARLVRPGGRLVYSTCTYNPAENEGVVNRFLEKHPEFETEAFRLPGAEGKDGTLLCLPHRMRGEVQFAALLRKKGSGEKARFGIPFAPPDREAVRVLRETVPGLQEPNATFGNTLIRIPECPEMKGIRVLRAGLQIAEIR